jgi:hypothetical protein
VDKGLVVKNVNNEVKSAASFCRWVAAWVMDMFCNFYLMKNQSIANNAATAEAVEKIAWIRNS